MKLLRSNSLLGISLGILILFSGFIYFQTLETYLIIEQVSIWIRSYFGRFYLFLGLGCVLLLIGIAASKWGSYKLGLPDEKPVFSRLAWISMLYSAGMGAGILLRAVQEPVFMFLNPPLATDASADIIALEFTFYQWGFTAWAFYAVFALAVGTALFRKKLPVAISSTFHSLNTKKGKSAGFKGFSKFTDILIILTTVFGLVAAIGLGSSQIKGGLVHLLDIPLDYRAIVAVVLLIGILASASALSGIEKGIKRISTLNIYLAVGLLLFVFAQGEIVLILKQFITSLYHYLVDFIPMSLAIGKYDPDEAFLTDWTYYYWAFWLAWAPSTGIFIARISRGRTLQEIIIGVLLIPSLGTFFWFTVFGQSAFSLIENWGAYQGEFGNVFTSLFVFLSEYPLSGLINTVVIVLLVSFLVTSLDSAIYVLSMFTDRGKDEPSRKQRILWSVLLTIFAVGIVLLGHVKADSDVLIAVQKLLIITSLPLSLLMVPMIVIWIRDLSRWKKKNSDDR